MELHGKSIIGGKPVASPNASTFSGFNATTGEKLEPLCSEATAAEADRALSLAATAFERYSRLAPEKIALFLDRVADEIMGLGDALIQRASIETALPEARLTGERARTREPIQNVRRTRSKRFMG